MSGKLALRARARAARDAFVAMSRPDILPPEAYLTRLAPGRVVASYIPIGSEADPVLLVEAAQAAGCVLVLPHVVSRAEPIRFLAWEIEGELATGPFGLQQPPSHAVELRPDIILTPLLGYDDARNRLGQGAGHYDRAFAAFPDAWRLGVAYSVQRLADLPVDPWDVPLHAIVTERSTL
jgi:5-formyltetrahydrofolate cyclo-ligase